MSKVKDMSGPQRIHADSIIPAGCGMLAEPLQLVLEITTLYIAPDLDEGV